MAARKTKPTPEPVEAPQDGAYDSGLTSDDVTLPRLRVVGNLAKAVNLGIANAGDIIIGQGAEDEESAVAFEKGGTEGVRFHILKVTSNYACGFNGPDGQWEEGDPDMPAEAKKQYHYTLFVPSFDTILPVLYTASGTAAREARKVNTAIAKHCLEGSIYGPAFTIATKINSSGGNSWPGPVFARVGSITEDIAAAKEMHDNTVAPPRVQVGAGDSTDPDY